MPGLDGTGPLGAGPMTGGGRGFCNPAWRGAYGPYYGGWYGRGRGFYGRGWGRRVYGGMGRAFWGPAYVPPYGMNPSEEAEFLKAEAEGIKRTLDEINKRIEELEKEQNSQ